MVKIMESNHDNQRAKSKVRISEDDDWEPIENANGWTNPRVQTANGSTGDNNHSPEQPISKFHEAKNAAIERARGINIGDPVGEPKYASTGDGKGWFQEFLNSDGNKRLLALEDGKETALWVHGDNLREYLERGGPEGVLGFPTNEETPYTADNTKTKGVWQGFSGSSGKARIHNHPSLGSVATWGAIGSLYTDMGGANSELGVPTNAEWEDNDKVTIWAEFELSLIHI